MIHKNKHKLKFKIVQLKGMHHASIINYKFTYDGMPLRCKETSYIFTSNSKDSLIKILNNQRNNKKLLDRIIKLSMFSAKLKSDYVQANVLLDFNELNAILAGLTDFEALSYSALPFKQLKPQKVPKLIREQRNVRNSKGFVSTQTTGGYLTRKGNIKVRTYK